MSDENGDGDDPAKIDLPPDALAAALKKVVSDAARAVMDDIREASLGPGVVLPDADERDEKPHITPDSKILYFIDDEPVLDTFAAYCNEFRNLNVFRRGISKTILFFRPGRDGMLIGHGMPSFKPVSIDRENDTAVVEIGLSDCSLEVKVNFDGAQGREVRAVKGLFDDA